MGSPSTYENIKSVPLAAKFNYRRGSYYQDAYVKNGFLEGETEGPYAIKRPGLKTLINFATQTGYLPALGVPLASYVFQGGLSYGNSAVDFVIGGRGFSISAVSGSPLTMSEFVLTGVPATGRLRSINPISGAIPWQGTAGIYRIGGAMINVGSTLVPSLCELDQTYYTLTVGGILRASALSDVTTWPALNTVTVFRATESAVTLIRHMQYLVAFSTQEIKVYYNAGISPGAPVAQETSFRSQIGLPFAAAQTAQTASDVTYWLGNTAKDGLGVYAMTGLQIQKISTPEVDRFLADNFTVYLQAHVLQSTASDTAGIRATIVQSGGHSFYILTCPTESAAGSTLTFDITTKTWALWDQKVAGVAAEMLCVANFGLVGDGLSFMPGDNNGKIYDLDIDTYQDDGQSITFEVQTDTFNWGNQRTKLLPATYVESDTLSSSYLLSWTDDDYTTYSVPQTVSAARQKKQLINCGSTVERGWKITHTDNTPMRFFGLEVEVVPGAL